MFINCHEIINIIDANILLNEPFLINGVVKKGAQLGRKMGFPTINIDEFNGSLTIEKCPNLVSMEGLFKQYFYKIYGNLIVNNCPKLTKLACPTIVEGNFQLVGNSSLKSLEGAPEMVTDEVYIMKNGKKFKEDQIKKYIPYVGDFIFCSEEGEKANINEDQIDEAFSNPYLMLLNKQLNEYGRKFKDIFRSNMAWDQIDNSHIQNYNWRFKKPSNKDLKAARAIISGKIDCLIIVYYYENNKIVFEIYMHSRVNVYYDTAVNEYYIFNNFTIKSSVDFTTF